MSTNRWKVLKSDTLADGSVVEMRYAEFGKGRAKIHCWEFFRSGIQVGYASTPGDAEVNWRRVRSGMVRNTKTGSYEYQ